jgi:hypothetical protein
VEGLARIPYIFITRITHINEIGLVSGMQVVHNRCLVEMCQFRHIICFVELCRIDFIDLICIYLSLLIYGQPVQEGSAWNSYIALIALHQQAVPFQLLEYQPAYERLFGVS